MHVKIDVSENDPFKFLRVAIVDGAFRHRYFKTPNDDYTDQPQEVVDAHNLHHTDEIKSAYTTHLQAVKDEEPKPPASTDTPLNKVQFFTFLELAFSKTPEEIVTLAQGVFTDPVDKIVAKNKILHSDAYHRNNPLFAALAPALGVTDEQIDAAWAQAVLLE